MFETTNQYIYIYEKSGLFPVLYLLICGVGM